MQRTQEAVEKFRNGYACSQAILSAYATHCGLCDKDALKISSGFAAGMRMGNTCGAVTGAYMVLGMHAAGEQSERVEDRTEVYDLIEAFSTEFEKRNGCLNCKDLIGCDLSKPEGFLEAKEQNLFKEKCPKFVQDASEILEELIGLEKVSG